MSTTIYILSRNMKNIRIFYLNIFNHYGGKIVNIFEKACFRNAMRITLSKLFCLHFERRLDVLYSKQEVSKHVFLVNRMESKCGCFPSPLQNLMTALDPI